MHSDQGFIDLRQHGQHQGSHSDDSVWPSFTDIMTVVVMVFLLALVAILIRNNELVDELRTTVAAERLAAEQARTTAEQKLTLEGRLGNLQGRVSDLTSNLSQTAAERDRTARTLEEKVQKIEALVAEVGGLAEMRDRLQGETSALTAVRDDLESQKQKLQADRDTLTAELVTSRSRLQEVETQAEDLSVERRELSDALAVLRAQFGDLETERNTIAGSRQALERALAALELKFGDLQTSRDTVSAQAATLEERLQALTTELQQTRTDRDSALERSESLTLAAEAERAKAATSRESLAAQIAALRNQMDLIAADRTRLSTRVERSEEALIASRATLVARDQELSEARSSATTRVTTLRGEYDELKQRYDKLVRPARSPDGRTVASVRYSKKTGTPVIEYRGPGETTFAPVNREQLEQRLDALKAKDPKALYTRIIFPENSGLTYNEAFRFESSILNAYDYYYQ